MNLFKRLTMAITLVSIPFASLFLISYALILLYQSFPYLFAFIIILFFVYGIYLLITGDFESDGF
jgi:CHASE2 domain-containing sensor protein